MITCPSCGGVIGRDCFNPRECAEIGFMQEHAKQQATEMRLLALELENEKSSPVDGECKTECAMRECDKWRGPCPEAERRGAYIIDVLRGCVSELEDEVEMLNDRAMRCETMDEAEKLALVRAMQEMAAVLGISPTKSSPRQIVDAVRALAGVER